MRKCKTRMTAPSARLRRRRRRHQRAGKRLDRGREKKLAHFLRVAFACSQTVYPPLFSIPLLPYLAKVILPLEYIHIKIANLRTARSAGNPQLKDARFGDVALGIMIFYVRIYSIPKAGQFF